MGIYFIALFILFLGAIISIFFNSENKTKICAFSIGVSTVLLFFPSLSVLFTGKPLITNIFIPPFFGDINFIIDPLSAFFILIISVMSFLGSIYAIGYLKPYSNKYDITSHSICFMLFILSMLMVVSVQNILFFLVVWEIMSLSSFFLVIFENDKKNILHSGIKYLIYMHISVIFIILSFALMNIKTGTLNFNDFIQIAKTNPHIANIVFLLAFTGFGIKAGFVPFHNWLPSAHPCAPSHISGIMSGLMIKTGIYGILRMLFITGVNSKFIAYTILIISIISALWGVLYAISRHDIKELLAYHSIENIGIIGIGTGIGLLGIAYSNQFMAVFGLSGAILHILNHSIFKELLFFASGSVYSKTHTRDVELLGGLIKKMPYSAAFFIIGAVAICAIPPFNGFISEFLIYAAMIMGLSVKNAALFTAVIISLSSLALIGTMAILCFTKVSGIMFLGTPRSDSAKNVESDTGFTMLLPMGILSLFAFLIGIFPQYAIKLVFAPVSMFVQISQPFEYLEQITSTISLLLCILCSIIFVLILLRRIINSKSKTHSTWGCGYDKPNSRMQYSASSYADLFISTLRPMFKFTAHIKKPKEIFPKEAYYEAELKDIEEEYIVKPLIKLDEKLLSKFEKIQNGNMQQYILWGLIFLILSIAGLIYFG